MNARPAPALGGVDHLHVFVADRAAALSWYEAVLGLRPVSALRHWADGGGPLTIADADDRIHLALFERPAQANRSTIAIAVATADWLPWQRHLRDRGIDVRPEDHGESWSMYFADPDDNPYELTCYDMTALRGGGASQEAINH